MGEFQTAKIWNISSQAAFILRCFGRLCVVSRDRLSEQGDKMQPISSAFQKLVVRRLSVHLARGDSPAVTLTQIRKMINNQALADTTSLADDGRDLRIVTAE
jgi:hypothetical protein